MTLPLVRKNLLIRTSAPAARARLLVVSNLILALTVFLAFAFTPPALAAGEAAIGEPGEPSDKTEGENTAGAEEKLSVHQKSIRWARPALPMQEIDSILEEIELNASRYGIEYDFATALVSAEVSLHPEQAFSRQWSSFMQLRRANAYAELDVPPVWEDLPNALSTMRFVIDDTKGNPGYADRSLKSAIEAYWMGKARLKNHDTVDRFYDVFREKYKAILGESPGSEEKLLSLNKIPVVFDELAGFSSRLPRMSRLDERVRSWPFENAYVNVIRSANPKLDGNTALLIARAILSFSNDTGVDPRLVMAVVAVESRFKPRATSPKGAMGLGQIMPATARSFGIRDPYEPVQNLWVCIRYLEREFYRYRGRSDRLDLVLAAYNAGPGAVKKYGGVPPYRETVNYIRKVKSIYAKLAG